MTHTLIFFSRPLQNHPFPSPHRPADSDDRKVKRTKKKEQQSLDHGFSAAASSDSGLRYRPKTKDTQRVYETLLSYILEQLGSQPQDVLCGAADEVLMILKDDDIKVSL